MKKTVLITGASRGIGREMAELFSTNNYNVAINYFKSEEEADNLYNNLLDKKYNIIKVRGDVRNRIQIDNMVNTIYSQFDNIDILVNNAGVAQQKLFMDISEDDWDLMFDVNIKGMFNCCQSVLPR